MQIKSNFRAVSLFPVLFIISQNLYIAVMAQLRLNGDIVRAMHLLWRVCVCRKDDAYYDSLAAKAAAAGGDNMSDTSDADPEQLLREMVRRQLELPSSE